MVAIIVVPAYLTAKKNEEVLTVQVVDRSGRDLAAGITTAIGIVGANVVAEVVPPDTEESVLLGRIRDRDIVGYLVLPADIMDGGTAVYTGANATNFRFVAVLRQLISSSVRAVKAMEAGIPPEKVLALLAPVSMETRHTTGSAETQSATGSFIIGYATMFILYMAILLYAVNVLRSVVQEKTSRVVEMIISAVKPHSLMLGKIIGVGSVGLFQLAIWAVMAALLIKFRAQVLGLFGVEGAGEFNIPALEVTDIALILIYFLAGYFFYASLYAAIGAMVNSDQEAQQAQTPVVILLIIPVVCVELVASDPGGGIAHVLTVIPFSSPVLMPMRYLLDGASAADVALSLSVLLLSTAFVVWLAARIYRVGILMYGKRPTLRELARWIRA